MATYLSSSSVYIYIYIMRKLKFRLDRYSLQDIHFVCVRPSIDYADVDWDNYTKYVAGKLDKLELEVSRIITGTTKLALIDNIYKQAGNPFAALRRHNKLNTLCFK